MNFTLITPTGDRPEAFARCEFYMARQTTAFGQWLVYDDGELPTKCTMGQDYLYCPQMRGPASLVNKLHHAFASGRIHGDAVAIIEDDDWYSRFYLERMKDKLATIQDALLVGEGCAVYYNVAHRWWWAHGNMRHASLCQTVIRKNAYMHMVRMCVFNKNPFVDVRLWRSVPARHIFKPEPGQQLLVGIKGMPGRLGYGTGHKAEPPAPDYRDAELLYLRKLIGADADYYEQFYEPQPAASISRNV